MGHHDSSISQPGSFNPYLEGMSYPGQAYGLYPHHFSKLRGGPHDLNGAYGDYPSKQQPAVPTYKWMQVKRNVPKPGRKEFHANKCADLALPTERLKPQTQSLKLLNKANQAI